MAESTGCFIFSRGQDGGGSVLSVRALRGFGGFGLALSEELNISIGEIPLRLHIPEITLREKASARYSRFFRESPEALPIFLQDAEDATAIQSRARHDSLRFSYNWNQASLVWQGAEAHFAGVHHEYGLDSLIRILLSVLLVPRSGFLLHAATILRGDHTYVFTGHSGAGKSTVASLSPAGSVLTDEISLLRATDEGWHANADSDRKSAPAKLSRDLALLAADGSRSRRSGKPIASLLDVLDTAILPTLPRTRAHGGRRFTGRV